VTLDLLVRDATIVDGSGAPGFPGSVGVSGDRIAWIGGGDAPDAARTIEGSGRVATPGFVDVHNHSDLSAFVDPWMRSTLRQGVTTVVVGNCGASPWPLAGWGESVLLAGANPELPPPSWRSWGDYLDALDEAGPAVNIATLVGHGSLRREVMGAERRPASADELEAMSSTAAQAIREGAFGLSTGLVYPPGMYAGTDELATLAGAVAREGGVYASHIRGEGAHLFRAVDEVVETGRRAQVAAHVSHLKCESEHAWGRVDELLGLFHGQDDVTADQYPYTAWNSSLASLLPPWAQADELSAIRDRERLRHAVEEGETDFQSSVDGVGWDAIVIVRTAHARWNGRDVASIAGEMDVEPFDAMVALLEADADTSCIGHAMREEDVRAIVADPEVFVASDAAAISPEGSAGSLPVHPREYGTFPRVLARYVREDPVLSLEQAIRKMTSLPAERFGLRGRGRLAVGAYADLVLFDPATVSDVATFSAPHAYAAGIDAIVVNGRVAWDGDWAERAGQALRREQ
jgi:N-acyl-D-aspartate/D-glutamate deacylase